MNDKQTDFLSHNESILRANIKLSTDDVLLEPATGLLRTRSNADVRNTYIYSSPMDTVTGIDLCDALLPLNQATVFCRYLSEKELIQSLEKYHAHKNYWFSVGANIETFQFLNEWVENHKSKVSLNVSVDIAHGDMIDTYPLYNKYANAPWCKALMSGTVATFQSALNVHEAGCTHIRVGIGPGSACSTRIVTGCGVPNLSAVYDVWSGFFSYDLNDKVTIIADGGIRNTGDAIKYLAAGADAVMIGNLFSKAVESHGWKESKLLKFLNIISFGYLFENKHLYKYYRGQASKEFQETYSRRLPLHVEGVQGPLQHPNYTTTDFILSFNASIASAISYLGLSSISQLSPINVKFLQISNSASHESTPHMLKT